MKHDPPREAGQIDVDRYLQRIGYSGPVTVDVPTLAALQRAHMTAVPFENLNVAARLGVRTDLGWSVTKIVDQRRGGWCFEVNGAFGALLEALGFDVILLGAAVLLRGPSRIVDHLALEVTLDEPWLVDVGFGEGFIVPLALNRSRPQDGGDGAYQLLASPEGTTLARLDQHGVPSPNYRFKRVAHRLSDFDEASRRLQTDPASPFIDQPFATRLLDGGPDRLTLLRDRLKTLRDGVWSEEPVSPDDWNDVLGDRFGLGPPL